MAKEGEEVILSSIAASIWDFRCLPYFAIFLVLANLHFHGKWFSRNETTTVRFMPWTTFRYGDFPPRCVSHNFLSFYSLTFGNNLLLFVLHTRFQRNWKREKWPWNTRKNPIPYYTPIRMHALVILVGFPRYFHSNPTWQNINEMSWELSIRCLSGSCVHVFGR